MCNICRGEAAGCWRNMQPCASAAELVTLISVCMDLLSSKGCSQSVPLDASEQFLRALNLTNCWRLVEWRARHLLDVTLYSRAMAATEVSTLRIGPFSCR